jgi:hypothetical protein
MLKNVLALLCFLLSFLLGKGQFLMDLLDTTKEAGKGLVGIYNKYDHLRIGGYIQPQFQVAQAKGARAFEGTDFSAQVNNRFMLRRSRIRIDYLRNTSTNQPGVQIVFQFDANERGFTLRDVWGRVFENKWQLFSLTTGMFARPFGFEVNLSSSDRESPERGRMSQLLMKSERDLGVMLSFEPRKLNSKFKNIRIDAGFFNGQGINAANEFDNAKDFIARFVVKPIAIGKNKSLSFSLSYLHGGLLQNTKYSYRTVSNSLGKSVFVDSTPSNRGNYSPRNYYGADAQFRFATPIGAAELRAEYVTGMQTGLINSSETPIALLSGSDGFYKRRFNGAYFNYIQQLFAKHTQLVLKYDWYDPDLDVKGTEIGSSGSKFTAASIRYSTLNMGLLRHLTPQAKLLIFYAIVANESTSLPGYVADLQDNVFTCRLQFRF